MSGKLLYVYASSRPSFTKRLTSNFPISVRGYCEASNKTNNQNTENGHVVQMEEKAPTTAEEFVRVAEEKAHNEEGLASQTIDKAKDAAGEVVTATAMGESAEFEHVKESFKEPPDNNSSTSRGNLLRRKGDEEEPSLPWGA